MSIDLSSLKPTKNILPPRVLIYGPEKIGKSSLLAKMPNTIFFDIEKGSGYVETVRYPGPLETYNDFLTGVQSLAESKHNFENLVIDTGDRLEEMIHAQAGQEHNKKTAGEVDYGKGYGTAENIWRQALSCFDYLRENCNMAIFIIGHATIRRYDNPIAGSYDRYNICLHENTKGGGSGDIVKHWSDACLFVNYEVFKKSEDAGFKKKINTAMGGNRYIYVQETPSFVAGNRWGMSEPIPYTDPATTWETLSKAIAVAMTK
jgi:hypothetical protein